MKNLIRKSKIYLALKKIKRNLSEKLSLVSVFYYDFKRFKLHYTTNALNKDDQKSLESWLLQDKHRIEKALSLPKPRYNFGEKVIERLIQNLNQYENNFCKNEVYYIAVGSIKAYVDFHKKNNVHILDTIQSHINRLNHEDFNNKICNTVGVVNYKKIEDTSDFFESFALSRQSCRNYDMEKNISREQLEKIMKITAKTPSVCNRQHWKLHVFEGEVMGEILKLQNGNLGFNKNIPYLGVITSDLRSFYMPDERTQPFTDGGMFAMSFIYALHSIGASSCALNWCTSKENNEKMYKVSGIEKNESIIMLIAFGYAKSDSKNACSPRLNLDNFYSINEDSTIV
ncbi:nitroreductase family protein [Photobacterium ganghwense]|uniref:nitroreductase family protein n=1 Tax=Photobacterium ganghwense TaxID=320778 RepID=UPI00147003A2|nr:nitroreductase family protein [Photobacterium ganghwense]QSV13334.1 nitroreductase family protein [Photobacterium ganghwense]